MKQLAHVLSTKFKSLLPSSEDDASQTSEQKKAVRENSIVMGMLGIAITGAALIRVIEKMKMKSNEWPGGIACEVWEMMAEKFRPKDVLSRAEQKKKLMKLELKREKILRSSLTQLRSWRSTTTLMFRKMRGSRSL